MLLCPPEKNHISSLPSSSADALGPTQAHKQWGDAPFTTSYQLITREHNRLCVYCILTEWAAFT